LTKISQAQYSTKVDIFSTGLICWELWHRELPFASLKHKHMRRIEELIKEGERPEIDDDCPPGLASLIRWCWQPDPALRFVALLIRALLRCYCVWVVANPLFVPFFTRYSSHFHPLVVSFSPALPCPFHHLVVHFPPQIVQLLVLHFTHRSSTFHMRLALWHLGLLCGWRT
jgi:hypothetical protein